MMMNKTSQDKIFYQDLADDLDKINRPALEERIMDNVEKIVLKNKEEPLALIDDLTVWFYQFYINNPLNSSNQQF